MARSGGRPKSPTPRDGGPRYPRATVDRMTSSPRTNRPTTLAHGPVDESGQVLHEDDLAAQLALTVTNLEAALGEHGLRWADVEALCVRTTDPQGLDRVLDTLDERLRPAGASPAVSVVPVTVLPLHGMALVLEATVEQAVGPTPTG